MKISRYNILTTVVVIAIAISIPFLISGATTTSQQQTNTPYNIFSPEVPTKINFAGKEHVCKREQEQQAAGNPVCDGVSHNKPSQRDESRSNAASTNCDNSSNHSNNPIVELQLRQNISCV